MCGRPSKSTYHIALLELRKKLEPARLQRPTPWPPSLTASYPLSITTVAHACTRAQRANAERIKEFSANLRKINSDTAAARRGGTSGNNRGRKGPAQDSRSKGLAFASRIPLPKKRPTPRKNAPSAGEPDPLDPTDRSGRRRAARRANGPPNEEGWESRELTELEALEREHDEMRRRVQAARSLF